MDTPQHLNLKQIIPSEVCLNCDVCCRFEEPTSSFTPTFLPEEAIRIDNQVRRFDRVGELIDTKMPAVQKTGCIACTFFEPDKNGCAIYQEHPLDCQLYPFMVVYQPQKQCIELVLDIHCPYFRDMPENQNTEQYQKHITYLLDFLEQDAVVESISQSCDFVAQAHPMATSIAKLKGLTHRFGLEKTGLHLLTVEDKAHIESCLEKQNPNNLAAYHFTYLYSWSSAFHILWKEIDGALCVFAGKDQDYFMFYPPLNHSSATIFKACAQLLKQLNGADSVPMRIEHVSENDRKKLTEHDFVFENPSSEFIYSRTSIARYQGNDYKSKRHAVNLFLATEHNYCTRPFESKDAVQCMALYRKWAEVKRTQSEEDVFKWMLEDSYFAHKRALFNAEHLGLEGVIVELEGAICAYSLGCRQGGNGFANLFEVCDENIPGIAAFVFQKLAQSLEGVDWINTLDASGILALEQTKQSYRPESMPVRYTAIEKH